MQFVQIAIYNSTVLPLSEATQIFFMLENPSLTVS